MLLTFVVFFVTLTILVLAHELGHFIAAKKLGIKVEEFGFGLPPRLLKLGQIGETEYTLNLLPIGGFVRLFGEDGGESVQSSPAPSGAGQAPFKVQSSEFKRAFFNQTKRVRTVVLIAGVVMNLVLAVVLFSIVYTTIGIPTPSDQVTILGTIINSPADGLLNQNDRVVEVDGIKVSQSGQFVELIEERRGIEVKLLVIRDEEEKEIAIIPRAEPPESEGPLGVVISDMEMKRFPWYQMIPRAIWAGFVEAFSWSKAIIIGLKDMLVRWLFQGQAPTDVAGPVGIFQITGGVARAGWLAVLQFIGMLSVNLAVINVLPFPALDGGRLLFVAYEAVTGKKARASIEKWSNIVGMVILLTLMLVITINDIIRAFNTTAFGLRLKSLFSF